MFSGAARVVRDWWNVRDRGLPTGIWNCASSLGPTIAPPLLTVLMISFGWRWMFVSMGLLGIVVAIVWYTVYREVAEAALSSGEAHHLTEGEEEPPPAQHVTLAEWGQLFGFRVTWGLILGFFGIVYMVWLFQAWLPGYFWKFNAICRSAPRASWPLFPMPVEWWVASARVGLPID